MSLRNLLFVFASVTLGVSAAFAQKDQPILEMHAAGELQIGPDGHVSDYVLRSKLAPVIANLVDKNVRGWTFEPVLVDGKPVGAKTAINLGLKAEPIDGDNYKLRIVSVHFGGPMRINHDIKPPKYPGEAIRAHVGGKVLLAVRLDEEGTVVEAMPYQTSLDVRARNEKEAEHYREVLENAGLAAAKTWRYNLSETINGKPVGSSALIPIEYTLHDFGTRPPDADGHWRTYLPGPIHPVPWMHNGQLAANQDLSAIADGEGLSLDSRFKLKNDVIGKTL